MMAFTLDAMSIYGQDTRMLDSYYNQQEAAVTITPVGFEFKTPQRNSSTRCFFFDLPLELRQQIYDYILPRTSLHPKGIVWQRGNTALLATNSRLHEEVSPLIYSRNTFVIEVIYDCSTFDYQWLLSSGLVPRRRLAFPEQIGERYLRLMQNISIKVHHVNHYTGMIKYNDSGSGLTDGLRCQVQFLTQSLRLMTRIRRLNVCLKNDTHKIELGRHVLDPLLSLQNVEMATFCGDIETEHGKMLSRRLVTGKIVPTLDEFPTEIRQQIYDHLSSPDDESTKAKGSRSRGSLTHLMALARTSQSNFGDVQSWIFKHIPFVLSINADFTYSLLPANRQIDHRARERACKHLEAFPKGISLTAFFKLRELHISVAKMSLDKGSQRSIMLEAFFDRLVKLLDTAPLKVLDVRYVMPGKKTSSGDGPTTRVLPTNYMTGYARSLGNRPQILPMPHNYQSTLTSNISGTPLETTLVSSPTTIREAPSKLLETPHILYLIAKLNPIMARIKTRKDGRVSVRRLEGSRDSQENSDDDSNTSTSDSRSRSTSAQILRERMSLTRLLISNPTRTEAEAHSSRSSSRRTIDRASAEIFSDVPI